MASRAGHAPSDRDLVTCLYTDANARRLSTASDAAVTELAAGALLRLAPSLATPLRTDVSMTRVERIGARDGDKSCRACTADRPIPTECEGSGAAGRRLPGLALDQLQRATAFNKRSLAETTTCPAGSTGSTSRSVWTRTKSVWLVLIGVRGGWHQGADRTGLWVR